MVIFITAFILLAFVVIVYAIVRMNLRRKEKRDAWLNAALKKWADGIDCSRISFGTISAARISVQNDLIVIGDPPGEDNA